MAIEITNNAIIAIISAILGGFITLFITYLNNRAKRFELEYNYTKKSEQIYLSNAQKHLEDLYIPLYSRLNIFQNNWEKAKNSKDYKNFKIEINELKKFKVQLEAGGLTAFLTPEVENSLDHLLNFLSKSQNASEIRYGIIEEISMLGLEQTSYRVLPNWINSWIHFLRLLISSWNRLKGLDWTGLSNYSIKIIVDSAPLASEDFNEYILKYNLKLKEKIKNITLGFK